MPSNSSHLKNLKEPLYDVETTSKGCTYYARPGGGSIVLNLRESEAAQVLRSLGWILIHKPWIEDIANDPNTTLEGRYDLALCLQRKSKGSDGEDATDASSCDM